jgi:ADP-ribose pyrophosphatase
MTNKLDNFPKRLSRKIIYKSPWVNLYSDKVRMPSGKIIENYHQLYFPRDSVVTVPYIENFILFIESLRYSQGKVTLELPAGGIDKGENLFCAAKREILEETGYGVKSINKLYTVNSLNGVSRKRDYILKAELSDKLSDKIDKDEVKATKFFSFKETQDLIRHKEIKDGLALNALLLFFNKL